MKRGGFLWAIVLPLGLACGSDATATSASAEDSGTSDAESQADDASESGDSQVDTSDDSATQGDDSSSDDTGGADNWARGIRITKLDANPGVAIPLAIDGQPTSEAERYTRLPARRPTWLFVHVEVEPGWQARELEAVFTIHRADGTSLTASQINEITGSTADWESDPDAGGASISEMRDFVGFYIGLPAEEVVPDTGISVELREVDPSYLDSPIPDELPVLPSADSGESSLPLGVEDSNNFFRLVMVPIAYDAGGCTATPDDSPTNIQRYADHLFASIPVEEVELVIHDPYPWNSAIVDTGDMSQILNAMGQLKAEEGEEPYTYYYALINNCGGCIQGGGNGCVAGLAQLPGDGMDTGDSLSRTGSGLLSTSTFVHEIGHTQGRRHIECLGAGAAGTDSSYPYDNGTLGSWGFDMREAFLHHPDFGFDYMSYCGPSWVSNWQWDATYTRIETLSSWASDTDAGKEPSALEQDLLVITVSPDGESRQFTTRGWLDANGVDPSVNIRSFDDHGEVVDAQLPARATGTSHSEAMTYVLPAPSAKSRSLQITRGGQIQTLALAELQAN